MKTSQPLYDTFVDQLIGADVTRPMWRAFSQQVAERLRWDILPDDLIVTYLCGHGLRDRRSNEWYFVTADAQFDHLQNDRYHECLSFSDLAGLSELPCRKLLILDSCHSGAVQPAMRADDLKSVLRWLQDDMVLTITASEGDEEAAEINESRMGRFTSVMVNGLAGEADFEGNSDQVVSLDELVRFVTREVASQSASEGLSQHPTASPEHLLPLIELPLSRSAQ